MPALMSWRSYGDDAGSTWQVAGSTGTAAGYDVGAVQSHRFQQAWRSAAWSGFNVALQVDFGVVRTDCRVFGLVVPPGSLGRPSSASSIELSASTAGAGLNDTLSVLSIPTDFSATGTLVFVSAAPVSARYVEFWLKHGGGDLAPYVEIGRAWVGPALLTRREAAFGYSYGAGDAGISERAARSGTRYLRTGLTWRRAAFALPHLTGAEAITVEDASAELGTTGQAMVARYAITGAATTTPIIGRLEAATEVTSAGFNRFAAEVSIEEDR